MKTRGASWGGWACPRRALSSPRSFRRWWGERVSKGNFVATIEKGAEYAGCRVCTPAGLRLCGGHSLRHLGIKTMARGGIGEPEIKAISRHSSSAVQGYIDEVATENTSTVARRLVDSFRPARPPAELPPSVADPWRSFRAYAGLIHFVANEDPKGSSKIHGATRHSECKCSYSPLSTHAATIHSIPTFATAYNICRVCLPEVWRRLMAEAAKQR